jgi:hypothetical protein
MTRVERRPDAIIVGRRLGAPTGKRGGAESVAAMGELIDQLASRIAPVFTTGSERRLATSRWDANAPLVIPRFCPIAPQLRATI